MNSIKLKEVYRREWRPNEDLQQYQSAINKDQDGTVKKHQTFAYIEDS